MTLLGYYNMSGCAKKNQGFSLVELMIALVIGLIVILGAGQLFLTSKQTYNQMEGLSVRQQSLRAITDFVSLDIRTASMVNDNGGDDRVLNLSYKSGRTIDSTSDPAIDPYCTGSTNLTKVEYRFDSEKSALFVTVSCNDTPQDEQELVNGLNDVRFTPDPERTLENGLFVWVDMEFSPMQADEPLEKTQYRIIVARRANVMN